MGHDRRHCPDRRLLPRHRHLRPPAGPGWAGLGPKRDAANRRSPEPGAEGPGHGLPRIPRVPETRLKQAAAVAKNVAVRAEAASNTVSRKVTEENASDELHGDAELLTEIARARSRAPSTESQMTSGCLGYQGKEACDAC